MQSADRFEHARREEIEAWIRDAKLGCLAARGRVLEACSAYLRRLAGDAFSGPLRTKCAPSDLVQDTQLDAYRDFAQFQGERLEELCAWLRRILSTNADGERRRFVLSGKREIAREVALDGTPQVSLALRDKALSPRSLLGRIERLEQVDRALNQLASDQRAAILLRSRNHCSFAEIGQHMQRSEEAARKLWVRGIERLKQVLHANVT